MCVLTRSGQLSEVGASKNNACHSEQCGGTSEDLAVCTLYRNVVVDNMYHAMYVILHFTLCIGKCIQALDTGQVCNGECI